MTETVERDREARWLLAGVVGLCVAGMALMAALDLYTFVWKTAVIPLMLVAVLATRRLGRFVEDWAVFLALVILFDFCRGFVFSLVVHFDLPVYMGYAAALERRICAGHVLPVLFQDWRRELAHGEILDRVLTVFHSSHFVFFLLFGMSVWLLRTEEFGRYKAAVLLLLYTGLVLYLAVPTVPPWMASDLFGVIPPIDHVSLQIYNVEIPSLQRAFDINPIAAMPSLHAGLPTLCALIGLRHYGIRALPLVAYTAVVWIAVVYLGEHYFADVLAGALLAGAVYVAVYELDWLPSRAQRRRPHLNPVLLSALLITIAEGIGQTTAALYRPWEATPAFVARELSKPGAVHYARGLSAFRARQFVEAQLEFDRASEDLAEPSERMRAAEWSARSAYQSGSYAAAVRSLEPLRASAGSKTLILLAVAYLQNRQEQEGMSLLKELTERFPGDPEPLYWMTRQRYARQSLTRAEVMEVVERMQGFPDPEKTAPFRRLLLRTIEGGES